MTCARKMARPWAIRCSETGWAKLRGINKKTTTTPPIKSSKRKQPSQDHIDSSVSVIPYRSLHRHHPTLYHPPSAKPQHRHPSAWSFLRTQGVGRRGSPGSRRRGRNRHQLLFPRVGDSSSGCCRVALRCHIWCSSGRATRFWPADEGLTMSSSHQVLEPTSAPVGVWCFAGRFPSRRRGTRSGGIGWPGAMMRATC